MQIRFFLLYFFTCCLTAFSQSIEQTYRNPVIPGDLPDPSVIRVGTDYYAVGTSNDFAPNYPLYRSSDLINWERIGSVFRNPPEWIMGSCWAPELFYSNGTYYVYYTARRKSDRVSCIGVATTKDITKGFTDHGIIIEWGSEAIDAFVFKDDDEKLYISWKAYGLDKRPIELLVSELNPDGLSLKGEHFSLTQHDKGWVGRGDEGQCLVKHGNYYYLLYSIGGCCDNRCTYNVRVARSLRLTGPWEQYEKEPLMQGGENWKCSGHGTLVQTPDNRYFYLYHAYNVHDFEFTGRQALLDELLWDETTGWPYFKYGNTPTLQAPVPFKNTVQERKNTFYDNFSSNDKDMYWQWDMKLPRPVVTKTKDGLKINGESGETCFTGINSQTGNYVMETVVLNSSPDLKGLSVYGDDSNRLSWGISGSELQLVVSGNGEKRVVFTQPVQSIPVYLKIESQNGRLFRVYWSTDKTAWKSPQQPFEHIDGSRLPRWGVGLRMGLITENGGEGIFGYFSLINQ